MTAVFVETNLGTRLAVTASPDITAGDFKREVEKTHLNCFPEFGNIRVEAVMVKKKLHCYHLSGTFPLKYAFLGSDLAWFLQTRVILSHVPTHIESSDDEANVHNLDSAATKITDSVELKSSTRSSSEKRTNRKRKKVKVRRFPYLKASRLKIFTASFFFRKRRKRTNTKKRRPKVDKEFLCQFANEAEVNRSKKSSPAIDETNSEPASVSLIINKYFSDYDEVASTPNFPFIPVQHRNSKKPFFQASRVENKKPEVGGRLLHASSSLRLTPGNRKSVLSLCHYNDGGSPLRKFDATVRHLAFEIADEGD